MRVRSTDLARNVSVEGAFGYSIDLTPNAIATLVAREEDGGNELPQGTPEPDSTPNMSFAAEPGGAPIAGYSYAWDGAADCVPETGIGAADFSLHNGTHVFAVRAIDTAGNCGAAASFVLVVDDPAQIFADDFEGGS